MSSNLSQTPLTTFFKSYNFQKYTYNPSNPPEEEFKLLSAARRWGPAKTNTVRGLFNKALLSAPSGQASTVGTPSPQLNNFFKEYEFPRFSYNPVASPEAEFQRLCEARGWGEKRLKTITKAFKKAFNSPASAQSERAQQARPAQPISEYLSSEEEDLSQNHTPIAAFLIGQNCRGYRYRRASPEIEFQLLISVKRKEWIRHNSGSDQKKRYKESDEFLELRRGFNRAVEEQFDWLLKVQRGSAEEKELRPWEILVEMFELGKAPIKRREAQEVLKGIYINIFDFIDFLEKLVPGVQRTQRMVGSKSKRAIDLGFPNLKLLGIYSILTHRVYALEDAKENGTLILLLQRIKQYFGRLKDVLDDFKEEVNEEAGVDFDRMSPAGIRDLLLSRRWRSLDSL